MANVLEILFKSRGGDQVKGETDKVNKATKKSTELYKTLGTMLSVGILAKGISSAIKAYGVQELAVTKLNAALKTQGIFTEELSKKLQDQASALQKITIFGDEAILSGQAFAMSMGVNADTVEKMTPSVLNFASAMGLDLQAAFKLIGQAAAGEVSMLKRYGIILTDTQMKNKDFNAVLDVMEKQFKGSAEAVAKSGIGPMTQFKNTVGDLQERIGEALIPSINDMIKVLTGWLPAIEKIVLGIIAVVTTAIEGIRNIADIASKVSKLKFKEAFEVSVKHGKNIEKIWSNTANKMVKIDKEAAGASEEIIKDSEEKKKKIRVELSDAQKKKQEEDTKAEAEKIKTAREKRIEDESKEITERYQFRRELRELDLEETINALESEFLEAAGSTEKRKALELSLADFKKELRVEEAVQIEAMNDKISELLVSSVDDWEGSWERFRSYVVDFVLKNIADELVKTLGLGKALKAVLGGATGGITGGGGFVGLLGGILGFQHGGTVPGPIGQPTLAKVHGGETITPPGKVNQMGGGVTLVVQINGTFIEADETKWDRIARTKIIPPLQRYLKKTGEQFSGS